MDCECFAPQTLYSLTTSIVLSDLQKSPEKYPLFKFKIYTSRSNGQSRSWLRVPACRGLVAEAGCPPFCSQHWLYCRRAPLPLCTYSVLICIRMLYGVSDCPPRSSIPTSKCSQLTPLFSPSNAPRKTLSISTPASHPCPYPASPNSTPAASSTASV